MAVKVTAYAKVNPVLNVIGNENGMHRLDTVILPVDFGDNVWVSVRSDKNAVCKFTDGRTIVGNTAERMADAVVRRYGTPGVDILIDKKIPEGAGLGGSSADAAAVMRAMRDLFGIETPAPELMREIGSDVYAQYLAMPTRLIGTGESAEPIAMFPQLYCYVLCGGQASKTKEVFMRYDIEGGENGDVDRYLELRRKGGNPLPFNALERAAAVSDGETKKGMLSAAGLLAVGMTGSGSSYVGYASEPLPKGAVEKLEFSAKSAGITLYQWMTLKG